jgi:hypothetical protein
MGLTENPNLTNSPGRTVRQRAWRILEPNSSGHRFWYVALLLDEIQRTHPGGKALLVTRPQSLEQPTWIEHLAPRASGGWRVHTTEESRVEMLRQAALAGDEIIVPDADAWIPALVFLWFLDRRQMVGAILLMRPEPDATWSSRARHIMKKMLLLLLRRLHPRLRIYRLVAVESHGNDLEDPVQFAPANVARNVWLEQNMLREDYKWVVALGEASERKCIDLLSQVMERPDVAQAGWALIVLGKPTSETIRAELTRSAELCPGRIVFRPQFLSDEAFDTWIDCADLVPVLHRNEGSSGVLLKCWAAGTPALVGGADSVVGAADELALNHAKVSGLTVNEVAAALLNMNQIPHRVSGFGWDQRSATFSRSLLGTNHESNDPDGS